MRNKQNRFNNILLLIFTALVTIVICEVILHYTSFVPETDQSNAKLIYKHYPNYHKLTPNLKDRSFGGIQLTTNEFGYRDDTMRLDKDDGVFRIAVLGDSWGFGWGVEYDKTFVMKLEQSLQEEYAPRSLEVLNFSLPSYHMRHHYYVLKDEVLQFGPDYCILFLHLNDVEISNENTANHTKPREGKRLGQSGRKLRYDIRNLKLSKLLYANVLLPTAIKLNLPNHGFVDHFMSLYTHDNPAFQRYLLYVDKFMEVLNRENLEVSVFLLPLPLARERPYQLQPVNDIIKDIFAKKGIQVIELLDTYLSYPKNKLIIHAYDGHPNEFASELLTKEIFNKLARKLNPMLTATLHHH